MRNYVKNKLQMYQAVRRVIQSNSASWNGLAAFENAVTRFSQKVTELENLAYQKSKALLGMKSTRDQKREAIAEQALYVSNALYAYASTIKDEKLKAEVHYSPFAIGIKLFTSLGFYETREWIDQHGERQRQRARGLWRRSK